MVQRNAPRCARTLLRLNLAARVADAREGQRKDLRAQGSCEIEGHETSQRNESVALPALASTTREVRDRRATVIASGRPARRPEHPCAQASSRAAQGSRA